MTFTKLADTNPLLTGHLRPDAMAIGDSLFNGVRSLSINRKMAHWSPVAQTTRAFGWDTALPDYPREVLFHAENELREGLSWSRFRGNALDNAGWWLKEGQQWSSRRFFDNISIAGAAFGDLTGWRYASSLQKAHQEFEALSGETGLNGNALSALVNLWINLNISFLLNPSQNDEVAELSALEQVASRRPKRLFINIGSNEGVFRLGIQADFGEETRAGIEKIPELATILAETLKEQCEEVEQIYFNLLIRPRVIGNLWTRLDFDEDYPKDDYYTSYIGRLGNIGGISGPEMEEADALLADINQQTVENMTAILGDRIHFVDIYSLADRFDGKHRGNARMIKVRVGDDLADDDTIRLSNLPYSANPGGFRHGGIFSLDNMHLTHVGYALMAEEMVRQANKAEGLDVLAPVSRQAAFEADTLLQNPVKSADIVNLFADIASDLGIFS